jgi:hypothetical protein
MLHADGWLDQQGILLRLQLDMATDATSHVVFMLTVLLQGTDILAGVAGSTCWQSVYRLLM